MERYDDEKLIDEITAQKLATAYSGALHALNLQDIKKTSDDTTNTTNQILSDILNELKEINKVLQFNKRIRLGL